MTALTRAALGPLNAEAYLAIFERFDDRGRTFPTWNWAAGLLTVNWMLLRQMWIPALVYLTAAEGLGLLVLMAGRTLLNWPPGVEWGLLAALLLVSCAVPGLWGNTLLYNDVRKKVDRALTQSATVQAAHQLLEEDAPSKRRMQALAALNVALLLAALGAWVLWPSPQSEPASTPAVSGKVSSLPASSPFLQPRASAASAATEPAPSASAAQPPLPTEPAQASLPSNEDAPTPAQAPASQASVSSIPPAKLPLVTASPPASAAKTAAQAAPPASKASLSPAAQEKPTPSAQARKATQAPAPAAAPAMSASAARKKASAEEDGKTAKPSKAKASAASATSQDNGKTADPLPPVGSTPGHYINVGLFADEANARKAQAKLLNEGFPAFRQELNTASGKRIRVRAGPYTSRAQAEQAAQSIQALGLEAVVFQKAK